jgi:hypothetical protein
MTAIFTAGCEQAFIDDHTEISRIPSPNIQAFGVKSFTMNRSGSNYIRTTLHSYEELLDGATIEWIGIERGSQASINFTTGYTCEVVYNPDNHSHSIRINNQEVSGLGLSTTDKKALGFLILAMDDIMALKDTRSEIYSLQSFNEELSSGKEASCIMNFVQVAVTGGACTTYLGHELGDYVRNNGCSGWSRIGTGSACIGEGWMCSCSSSYELTGCSCHFSF